MLLACVVLLVLSFSSVRALVGLGCLEICVSRLAAPSLSSPATLASMAARSAVGCHIAKSLPNVPRERFSEPL